MPDEVPRPVPQHLRGSGAADFLDQALEFRRAFGVWPATWREFVAGSAHLARAGIADKLRMADAFAATQNPDGWQKWSEDHRALLGD